MNAYDIGGLSLVLTGAALLIFVWICWVVYLLIRNVLRR